MVGTSAAAAAADAADVSPATAPPDGPPALDFKPGHGAGRTSAIFFTSPDGSVRLLTCGGDGKVALRHAGSLEVVATHTEDKPVEGLSVYSGDGKGAKAAPLVALAVDMHAKLLDLPSLDNPRVVGRTNLPLRTVAFSPDGSRLAAAGDTEGINIYPVRTDGGALLCCVKSDPYVRAAVWDPEGDFLATTEAPGYMAVFNMASDVGKRAFRTRGVPKTDPIKPGGCRAVAWHPDGSMLAVASGDNDVALYLRFEWKEEPVFLSNGHTQPVTALAFSPNGLYMATGSSAGELCVWDVSVKEPAVLSRSRVAAVPDGPAPAPEAIVWHPNDNALVVADAAGRIAVWATPVPEEMVHPAEDPEAVARRAAETAASTGKAGGVAKAGDADVDGMDGLVEDDTHGRGGSDGRPPAEERRGGAGGGSGDGRLRVVREIVRVVERAPEGPPPQPPMQPGATDDDEHATGPNRGHRFLAYNMLGYISTGPGVDEDCFSVEASFHDTLRMPARVPILSDPWGLSMAALSISGALHASATMLVYRPFDSWSSGLWTALLPAGEECVAVAAGGGFCAAATSRRLLRLYTAGGVQTGVMSLCGDVVALAAQEEGSALAVVTHAAAPDVATRSQNLQLEVYDTAATTLLERCALPLSPGALLSWLGFTSDGLPVAYDTHGVLRLRSPQLGGSWLPVFDGEAEGEASGAWFWPVGVSAGVLTCIVCPRASPQPALHPRPVFSRQALSVPLAAVDGAEGSVALESQLLLQAVAESAARARSAAAAAAHDPDAAAVAADAAAAAAAEADVTLLKLLNESMTRDAPARALELVGRLTQERMLEGAVKLANGRRMPRLAEAIGDLLQARRLACAEAEAEQELMPMAGAPHAVGGLRGAAPPGDAPSAGSEEDGEGAAEDGAAGGEPLADVTAGVCANSAKAATTASGRQPATGGAVRGGGGGMGGGGKVGKPAAGGGATKRKLPSNANPFARSKKPVA